MVKEQLTSEMIQLGKDVLHRLDDTALDVRSALWFYLEDSEKWRLFLATPQVRVEGPKKVYQQVKRVLSQIESESTGIDLKDISVVEDNHSIIKIISGAIGQVPGVSEVRFSRNTIHGHYIEDALIYRLNYQQKAA